jgi:hypothetical protein
MLDCNCGKCTKINTKRVKEINMNSFIDKFQKINKLYT